MERLFLIQTLERSYYVSMPSVYINDPYRQTVQSQADKTNSVILKIILISLSFQSDSKKNKLHKVNILL